MTIEKKVWRKYFEDILNGKKSFEVRLADFSCNEGDTILLKEWDESKNELTGRQIEKKVSYLVRTKDLPFWDNVEIGKYGYQIIGLK